MQVSDSLSEFWKTWEDLGFITSLLLWRLREAEIRRLILDFLEDFRDWRRTSDIAVSFFSLLIDSFIDDWIEFCLRKFVEFFREFEDFFREFEDFFREFEDFFREFEDFFSSQLISDWPLKICEDFYVKLSILFIFCRS